MFFFISIWVEWFKRMYPYFSGKLVILDKLHGRKTMIAQENYTSYVDWRNEILQQDAKNTFGDSPYLLDPNSPLLLSNFIEKIVKDQLNVEGIPFDKYIIRTCEPEYRKYIRRLQSQHIGHKKGPL